MEKDYKITYNLGAGIQIITFVVALVLVLGATKTFIHQAFVTRTLNNGYTMQELATYRFQILLTAAGLVITCLLIQRLLVNELLTQQ